MASNESKCVNCQRCVCFYPTHALKIQKSSCALRENNNWDEETVKELYRQAGSGGVLLSSMGNLKRFPVYWDKILINTSQVTNPPIDPLREPMETKVFLGKKPEKVRRRPDGRYGHQLRGGPEGKPPDAPWDRLDGQRAEYSRNFPCRCIIQDRKSTEGVVSCSILMHRSWITAS
jgi:glutamate synthase domain-containing protein 2